MKQQNEQQRSVVEEFTKKAAASSTMPGHDEVLRMMLDMLNIIPEDTLLDVACGGGLVTCTLAPRIKHATGIDITPLMIERAKQLEQERGLKNVSWRVGDVSPLPFLDSSYSLVICRYAFHHFPRPAKVLKDMTRVCSNGGAVMVVDVALPQGKRKAFDRVEKLKDPSHVSAMTPEEFVEMAKNLNLKDIRTRTFSLHMRLSTQIKPTINPAQIKEIRNIYEADIGKDELGVGANLDGDEICFHYPSIILTGTKIS